MSDKCLPILQESGYFTKKEAEDFRRRMESWKPEEFESNRDFIEHTILSEIEDGIDAKRKQVSDMMSVKTITGDILKSSKTGQVATTMSEAITNRLENLIGRNSVDTRKRSLSQAIKGELDNIGNMFDLQSNKQFKSLSQIKKGSPEENALFNFIHDYTQSIDIEKLTPESIRTMINGKSDIEKLGMSIVAYNEYARKLGGKYGVSVRFNKNYVMKRRYDYDAFQHMGRDKFADFMYSKLDIEQTFGKMKSADQVKKELAEMFDSFATDSTERSSFTNGKEFASDKSNSIARSLFYKDAQSSYDAFNQLSLGGMREQFEKNANSMASTYISVSEFGYEPDRVLAEVNKNLANTFKGQKAGVMDAWKNERIRMAELELTGQQNLVSGAITNFANNTRFVMAASKLGNAVTGTILDVVDNGRQVFYTNGNVFGGFADFAVAMKKVTLNMSPEQRLEVAQGLGISLNHISMAESMRLADGTVGSRGGKITQWIQEHGDKVMNIATLLPAQTSRSKVASGLVGAQTFSKMMDKIGSGGVLNKFELDTIKEYGFNQNEIRTLTSGIIERSSNWVSNPIYTANGIRQSLLKGADEAHIMKTAKMLGVKPEYAGKAVLDLATKYESFLNDFVVRGTPTPALATKTALFKGVNNEALRAVIGLGTQFLDTPIAQLGHMTELYSKLERINDSRIGMLKDALPHAATYLSVALPSYFAADYAMSIATNRESIVDKLRNGDDDTRRKVLTQAIGRSGVVPFLFEVADAQWGGGYNKTALDSFGSPALSTLKDVMRLGQSTDSGGMSFKEFALRQGPTNSLPLRALNNWSDAAVGEKLWETKQNTFFQ